MGKKFIPNGDYEFAAMAGNFARVVARDPEQFGLTVNDAEALVGAAGAFDVALQKARTSSRSPATIREKEEARAEAVRLIKRAAAIIRVCERVTAQDRYALGMKEPSQRKQPRPCPQEPPNLRFVRALHTASAAMPMHELRFSAAGAWNRAKPDGAVRLELFCDLVGADEPIPSHPGANYGGRPWYLRSYSRSPIKLTPPMGRVPMMVVYWGRWADAIGNVGPWSKTVVSRVEALTPPMMVSVAFMPKNKQLPVIDGPSGDQAAAREQRYSVAVRDAQYAYFNPAEVSPTPPAPALEKRDTPQLEGPPTSEAA
jgi:hypothetical protein